MEIHIGWEEKLNVLCGVWVKGYSLLILAITWTYSKSPDIFVQWQIYIKLIKESVCNLTTFDKFEQLFWCHYLFLKLKAVYMNYGIKRLFCRGFYLYEWFKFMTERVSNLAHISDIIVNKTATNVKDKSKIVRIFTC